MTSIAPKTGRAARATDHESVERRTRLETWQKSLSDQVVSQVLRYRDLRGISNDELRQRLARLGWDLTKDSLASILASKRKSMPISDVLLFAQAFNVPPAAIIFPLLTNEPTPLWPGDNPNSYAYQDVQWFTGTFGDHGGAYVADPDHAVVDEYRDIGDVVWRFDDLEDLERNAYFRNYQLARVTLSDERRAEVLDALQSDLGEIFHHREFLVKVHRGIKLPPLHPALAFLNSRKLDIPELPIEAFLDHPIYGRTLDGTPKNSDK